MAELVAVNSHKSRALAQPLHSTPQHHFHISSHNLSVPADTIIVNLHSVEPVVLSEQPLAMAPTNHVATALAYQVPIHNVQNAIMHVPPLKSLSISTTLCEGPKFVSSPEAAASPIADADADKVRCFQHILDVWFLRHSNHSDNYSQERFSSELEVQSQKQKVFRLEYFCLSKIEESSTNLSVTSWKPGEIFNWRLSIQLGFGHQG